ncbi:MAG: DUF3108 domain-containing protein [Hyphomicrobiales bacterium]
MGAAFLTTAGANQAAAQKLSLEYSVTLLGVEIYTVDVDVNIGANAYGSDVNIKSAGVVGFVSSGGITAAVNGLFNSPAPTPRQFKYSSKAFGSTKSVAVTWSDGQFPVTKRDFDIEPKQEAALANAISKDIKDPLSLVIAHMIKPANKTCSGKNRLYTGRAVYGYSLTAQGVGNVESEAFTGKAYKCRVTYRLLAGGSDGFVKSLEDNPPKPVSVWFVPITSSGQQLLMPVAAETSVKGQSLVVSLTGKKF